MATTKGTKQKGQSSSTKANIDTTVVNKDHNDKEKEQGGKEQVYRGTIPLYDALPHRVGLKRTQGTGKHRDHWAGS